jgi:hypothetical protein
MAMLFNEGLTMTKVFQINSMHLNGWTIEAKKPLHAALNKVLFQDAEFNGFNILDGKSGYHPAPLIMALCGELKNVLPEYVCENYSYIPIARYLQDYFDQTWGRLPLTCQRLKKGVNGINPSLRQFLSQIDFVNDFKWQADLADTSAFNGIDHLFSMLIDNDCLPDSIDVKVSPNTGEITMHFSRPAANTSNRNVDSTIVFRKTSDKTLSFDIESHPADHALQEESTTMARPDALSITPDVKRAVSGGSMPASGSLLGLHLSVETDEAKTLRFMAAVVEDDLEDVSIAITKKQIKARKPTTQQLKRYKQLCNLSAWHVARGTQMPKRLMEEASNMCLRLDMPD